MTLLEVPAEREWMLEGCCNFRDVGGLRTGTGASVRTGRLFRSDSLAAASVGDCERLARHGLRTVIDLRCADERAFAGIFAADGVRVEHVPLGEALAVDTTRELWTDPARVADRYFTVCTGNGDAVAEVLAVLTDPAAYPAVVHCSIGKDRTGVVVALLLRALGVPTTDVVDDYALSGAGTSRLVQRLRREVAPEALEPYLPALLSAEPATMRAFLRLVHDEYGSVRGYLRAIDMDSAVDYLRAALIE